MCRMVACYLYEKPREKKDNAMCGDPNDDLDNESESDDELGGGWEGNCGDVAGLWAPTRAQAETW